MCITIDRLPYLHNVTLCEAQIIFFDHIRAVIFDEHELSSLQSLLQDHGSIISRSYIWSEVVLHQRNPDQGV